MIFTYVKGEQLQVNRLKGIIAVLLIGVIAFSTFSIAWADNCTAKDYMVLGIRAAYDNMYLIYKAYYDDEGTFEVQPEGHVAIFQE